MAGGNRDRRNAEQKLHWMGTSDGDVYVPFRLLLVSKMLDRSISAMLLREGQLTLAQWRVLANLRRLGQSSVIALADYAQVDRAEVSRAAAVLERRQLVAREIHPDNRSKLRLTLTETGAKLAEKLAINRRDHYSFLLEGLDDEQRKQFDRLLRHLATRVVEYDQASGDAADLDTLAIMEELADSG